MSARLVDSDLIVPLEVFQTTGEGPANFRDYVLVRHERLKHPIYLRRTSDDVYSALWMSCTHQGTELRSYGDRLECPAHGSTFSTKGEPIVGPAVQPLRTFPVKRDGHQLLISLRT